jgi:putative membrane protein
MSRINPEQLREAYDQISQDLQKMHAKATHAAGNWFQRFIHRPWTNPWRIFARDFKSITTNAMGMLVVIGLIIVPCLYAWFNIAGCWDVYSNTGGLQVAVANTDKGYRSSLIPVKVNVGDELVSRLRANKQLGWQFVSQSDALDGVKSGKYYASIVIPSSFSADMMTLFSKNVKHASILYYSNAKENPLAPTVTGEGANEVTTQVNSAFTSTLTDVGLEVADTLSTFLHSSNAQTALTNLSGNLNTLAGQVRDANSLLGSYQSIVDASQQLLNASSHIAPSGSSLASTAQKATSRTRQTARDTQKAISSSTQAIEDAIVSGNSAFQSVSRDIERLYSQSSQMTDSTASSLTSMSRSVTTLANDHRQIGDSASSITQDLQRDLNTLDREIAEQNPSANDNLAVTLRKAAVRGALSAARTAVQRLYDRYSTLADAAHTASSNLTRTASTLQNSADQVRSHHSSLASQRSKVSSQLTQTKKSLDQLKSVELAQAERSVRSAASSLTSASSQAVTMASTVDSTIDRLSDLTGSASQQLTTASNTLASSRRHLKTSSDKLSDLSHRFTTALKNHDTAQLEKLTAQSPEAIASIVAAPIGMHRHAIYPVKYFGEQMTPFYAILALWVASTLLAASSKSSVSSIKRRGLLKLRQRHLYFGRYLSVLCIALIQGTALGLGCLFFLKVQAADPWLFMATCWIASLVFSNFIYTMGYVFGVIGKAICVFFMTIQISGANGMYPVQMMPDFFARVRPWLPATYAMNALRESIAGVYGNEWTIDILYLLAFMVPMLLIGLLLYRPLQKIFSAFARQTAASHLMGIS